ncbi:glycoside hydrolase family 6 protein [Microlunatus elymi]|nr:glycoside hydrolase family 6 protein [Microlunatus elymi]
MSASVYESTNPQTGATLLTTWKNESTKAKAQYGFTKSRGTPFKVSRNPPADGLIAVHRLYNSRSHDFIWTKSSKEVQNATAEFGYRDQGTDFYASMSGGACLTAVHRYVKDGVRRYATTASEQKDLKSAGWRYENVAFYAASAKPSAPKTTAGATSPKASNAKPATAKVATSTTNKTAASQAAVKTAGSRPSSGPYEWPAYLNKSTQAWNAYSKQTNRTNKALLYQIASTETSIWLGGRTDDQVRVDKIMDRAAAAHRTPQLVLYAIPNRDCGGYAAGGLNTVSRYKGWIDSVRRGLAGRKAVIIVEPDAIGMGCLSSSQRADRYSMLKYAMTTLTSANTWTYLHAGSSGLGASDVAAVLKKSGIADARGFAVNVSSFDTTSSEIKYGNSIIKALGMKKHFVIDTSRGGLGRASSNGGAPGWCNPPGRALGTRPTIHTANSNVDAYLWVKPPGESDGSCHSGDPASGQWFGSYALGLAQRALDHKIISRRALP